MLKNKRHTALVSVTDRPIEALHRAFVKYNNLHDEADDIWIAIISVPVRGNDTSLYHHAEDLALDLEMGLEESRKFRHEYLFEWEIPDQYVKHMVSVETLLDRGLNLDSYLAGGLLPDLQTFQRSMIDMFLDETLDGYCVGKIAHNLLTDCPLWTSIDDGTQYCKWAIEYDSNTREYTVESVDLEYLWWISKGISEALFDSWLVDSPFVEESIAHAKWSKRLRSEMEIQWEVYFDRYEYVALTRVELDSAADDAQKLQEREQKIHDLIERDAISIGL
ncbi:unnamed protein product [Penicillium glandicola]